jgi:hypothetical protein
MMATAGSTHQTTPEDFSAAGVASTTQARSRHDTSEFAEQIQKLWDDITSCMSRYPLATLLTGVGLGLFLGQAFTNRLDWDALRRQRRSYPMNIGP